MKTRCIKNHRAKSGVTIINDEDFDPEIHEEVDPPKAKKPKKAKKAKKAKTPDANVDESTGGDDGVTPPVEPQRPTKTAINKMTLPALQNHATENSIEFEMSDRLSELGTKVRDFWYPETAA